MTSNKVKRLPTRFLVGAYKGSNIVKDDILKQLREIDYRDYEGAELSVLNMVIFSKDIVGIENTEQLGTPAAMTDAAKKAIRDGMIEGITDGEDDDEVINKVKGSHMLKISDERIKKIGGSLEKDSSAIICVFKEVLVNQDVFETDMVENQENLTDRVKTEIETQLAHEENTSVAVHVVLDNNPGQVLSFDSVVGNNAPINIRNFIDSAGRGSSTPGVSLQKELDALRKQGVTKKNANELKDAKGLSTPEAAENAIKAEQERTRLSNYGKEASDYLKSGSPEKNSAMPATPEDNANVLPKTTEENASGATKQSKDITDMIQITNDFAFVDNTVDGTSDEGGEDPMQCFSNLPSFCPIDSNVVDDTTRSMRGAFDQHVAPTLDGASKSIRGALDEHVVPTLGGASKSIRGALDEHVVPGVEKIRRKSMETINLAKSNSLQTIESVKEGSQKIFGEVQEKSKAAVDDVSAKTTEVINEKVKPGWSALIEALTVTYVPYYAGTAPGWASLPTNSSVPLYWVLKEATLRAFGRVVFCDNPATGLLIWLGILCSSPFAALCSLFGALTANATALYLELDEEITRSGQYARNAVLIGPSVVHFFTFDFPSRGNLDSGVTILLFLSVALAPVTLIVESIWMKRAPTGIPSLLLPFNIVFVFTIFCAKIWNLAMATQVRVGPVPAQYDLDDSVVYFSEYSAVCNSLSMIFFVGGNTLTGILILIGAFFCSRIIASSLLAGSFIASIFLGHNVFNENYWYLDSGYVGFNPALFTAGIFFYLVPSVKLTGLAVFGIVATMIMQGAVDVVLGILGAPMSTSLGFCLTLLPLLSMDLGSFFGNRENYFIRTIPVSELSTPENYLKSIDDDEKGTESAVIATEDNGEEDPEAPFVNEETPLLT